MTLRPLLGFAVAALAACAWSQSATFPFETEADRRPKTVTSGNVLIQGARVVTVTKGTLDPGDVLVQGGKIVAVGRRIAPPPGVTVIDARGKTLVPGFVDGHSHRCSDGTNEGTESVTCEVRIGDVLNPGALNVWQALASGHTAALILHGSANAIGGESVVVKYKYQRPVSEVVVPDAPRQVKFALGENVTRKNSREPTTRYPRTRMGVETVYRRAFQEARDYASAWAAYEADRTKPRPRRDLRLETLAGILAGKVWVQCHSYRADEMLMMARLSQEFGFRIGALQHALEGYKIAPELAEAKVPMSIFVDNWSFKLEGYDGIPWNAAICHRAGVLVSINTDGVSGTTALNIDAAKVMRFGGLSEDEALAMVTINPAKQLGIDHRTGSIEVGKDADLGLWSGNPLSVYSKPVMTLVEGEVYFERRDAFGVDPLSPVSPQLARQANRAKARPPRSASTYAIVGATVYPVSRAPIPGATVVVSRGRITAVGVGVTVPSGASVIDGKGLRVYPGFMDAFSSLGLGEIGPVGATMDNVELGQVQPDLDTATALWVESAHYGPNRYNGVTHAFAAPSFGLVSGRGAVIHMDGLTNEEMTLERAAALVVNPPGGQGPTNFAFDACDDHADASRLLGLGGADEEPGEAHSHEPSTTGDEHLTVDQRAQFFDLLGGRQDTPIAPQETGAQGAGEIDRTFDAALEYYKKRADDPSTPRDLGHEALRPFLTQRKLVVLNGRSPAAIRAAVAFAQKYRLNAVIRGASGAWKEADLLRRSGIPVILTPAGRSLLGANSPDSPWDPYDTPYVVPFLLQRAGVRFCFGMGSPADIMNLPVRAAQHCAYGLRPEDALRALTLTPAEVFGVADRVGSIDVGKIGNLIVTDGDPFELTTTVRHVFVNGQPRPMTSKHTQLRDRYQGRN